MRIGSDSGQTRVSAVPLRLVTCPGKPYLSHFPADVSLPRRVATAGIARSVGLSPNRSSRCCAGYLAILLTVLAYSFPVVAVAYPITAAGVSEGVGAHGPVAATGDLAGGLVWVSGHGWQLLSLPA
jgi:hypothetical protein